MGFFGWSQGRCVLCCPCSDSKICLRLDKSAMLFDDEFVLKEDYDCTCRRLRDHKTVLQANRLILSAIQENYAGGACTKSDADGLMPTSPASMAVECVNAAIKTLAKEFGEGK